jgi:hypothetical protein
LSFVDSNGSPISIGTNCEIKNLGVRGDSFFGVVTAVSFSFYHDVSGSKKARREILVKKNGDEQNYKEWIPIENINVVS